MNNKLYIENFSILIIWSFIFMVILPWDQEKIVVLNLILFLYFLYYMLNKSITDTFYQKKEVTLQILNFDLINKISLLNKLLKDNTVLLNNYSNFLLSIINKYIISLVSIINLQLTNNIKSNTNFNIFSLIVNNFFWIKKDLDTFNIQKNILISKYILNSSNEFFEENINKTK